MRRRTAIIGSITALILVQSLFLAGYAVILLRTEIARDPDAVASRQLSPFLEFGRTVDRAISFFLRAPQPSRTLPKMDITIVPSDWDRLQESLPKEGGIYDPEHIPWVAAKLFSEGRAWDIHLRILGELEADWSRSMQSLEIRFPEGDPYHSIQHLHLLLPDAHAWLNDILLMHRSRALGLVHPDIDMIQASINGRGPMVYLSQEVWSSAMAQRQGRGGSAVLYGVSPDAADALPATNDPAYWQQDGPADTRAPADALTLLLELSRPGADSDPEYLSKLGQVIDIDRLAAYIALRLSMGNPEGSARELQLLYRSDTGRFEPVVWHMDLSDPRSILAPSGIPLIDTAARVPSIRSKAQTILHEMRADASKEEQFVSQLYKDIEAPLFADRWKLSSNRMVRSALTSQIDLISHILSEIYNQIESAEVLIDQRVIAQSTDLLLALDVSARGPVAAELLGIQFPPRFGEYVSKGLIRLLRDMGDSVLGPNDLPVSFTVSGSTVFLKEGQERLLWPGNPAITPEGSLLRPPHRRHRFYLVRDPTVPTLTIDALPLPVIIGNAITKGSGSILGVALIDETASFGSLVPRIDRTTFLKRNPVFKARGGSGIVLTGSPVINGVVLIPPDISLIVDAGTRMRMGSGASLVAFGPVTMIGSIDAPIRIEPERSGGAWGTVAIVDAPEPSDIRFVRVEGGRGATVGSRVFPASLVFAGSPGSITQVEIRNAEGPVALALSRVFADIRDTTVTGSYHSGIKIESALAGRLENVTVSSSSGAAITLLGSPVVLRNIIVDGSASACLHIADRAAPLIEHSRLQNCVVGIQTMNGGHAIAKHVTLVGNGIGFSAQGGVPAFGAGSIVANDTVFIDNAQNILEGSGGVVAVE